MFNFLILLIEQKIVLLNKVYHEKINNKIIKIILVLYILTQKKQKE